MKLEILCEIINASEGVAVELREEILKWIFINFLESKHCPVCGATDYRRLKFLLLPSARVLVSAWALTKSM